MKIGEMIPKLKSRVNKDLQQLGGQSKNKNKNKKKKKNK
jgi:hypothetical protein